MTFKSVLASAALVSLAASLPANINERETACVALGTCSGTTGCPDDAFNDPDCGTFEWGSIGDSWCSGIAYSDAVQYDGNADGCMRVNHAWSAQLENDPTWTKGTQTSAFKGCSGSTLVDMHGYGTQGRNLISQTGNPQVVFMSAGGNNAAFGAIVEACIYQPYPTVSYGLPYESDPSCTGLCCQALQNAQNYIDNLGGGGLSFDLGNTIDDLFGTDQARSHDEFWLYINGYAHFFNVDTSGPGTCDDWSFAPFYAYWAPKVTQPLRQRMNDVLNDFNQKYQDVISGYDAPDNMHVGYISITEGFNGHRFCEAGTTFSDQWATNTWIWNQSLKESQGDPSASDTSDISVSDGPGMSQDLKAEGSSGSGGSSGLFSRPFHPTESGHNAIKNATIAKLRADGVPGVTSG